MQDPEVILADEPFASLDPALTETVASLLLGLVQNGKRTLVATLHDIDLALRYFPRIIALRDGLVAFDTTPHEVSREVLAALYATESAAERGEICDEWAPSEEGEPNCEPSCAR
jgi:phosphonate transport system ATP-binding protein